MRIFIQQTWGVFIKDILQWSRDKQAAAGPMVMAFVLMFLCAVVFGFSGDEWNIGLIVEGDGSAARSLANTIEETQGNISPYFRIVTRDADEARNLVAAGRIQMVITIPEEFDALIESGKAGIIETQLFNINTDLTKNVRLRLDHAIQDYLVGQGEAPVTVVQTTTRSEDVWRRAFIAGGAIVVTLLVGGSLNTGIITAREWEHNTIKEITLAPQAVVAVATGKLIAGLAATIVNVAISTIVAVLLFGLGIPANRWLPLLGFGFGSALAAAGIGMGLGACLRDYRTLQPLLMVMTAGSFFAAGGFSSANTLPAIVRQFDVFWPPTYVFETMQMMMHGAEFIHSSSMWWILMAVIILCLSLGVWMFYRAINIDTR